MDHLDQSFNLSDYPALVVFDGYHNTDLRNVDPTGCPLLQSLSVELTPCASLDVSKNPLLQTLTISDSTTTPGTRSSQASTPATSRGSSTRATASRAWTCRKIRS